MIKTLIKKQFMELNQIYFHDTKTGKNRSLFGTIMFSCLFVSIFIFLAGIMFTLASLMADPIVGNGVDWLYFAMMGIMSIFLGVFGSAFNTYAGLYLSKDNELLLSMPIPPSYILASRMFNVVSMSLLYSAIVWIPAVICYVTYVDTLAVSALVNCIILTLVLTIFVSVLTCVLGWGVAMISQKIKGKSFLVVIISIVFLATYYYVYFNLMDLLTQLGAHLTELENGMKTWAYIMYCFGRAAEGDILSLVLFTLMTVVLFVVCYYVLSHNFTKIVTSTFGEKTKAYDISSDKKTKTRSVESALFYREIKRFVSSANYMLNCGLGVVFMVGIAVAAIIKSALIGEVAAEFTSSEPVLAYMLPAIILTTVMSCISMNAISAPSVSLEGKTYWLIRSLPVDSYKILMAKEKVNVVINIIPAIFATVVLGIVLGIGIVNTVLITAISALYTVFSADLGLVLNLLRPNLNWTNETVPIKQSMSMFIAMFGGMVIAVLVSLGSFLMSGLVSSVVYNVILIALFAVLIVLLKTWLRKIGTKKFEEL